MKRILLLFFVLANFQNAFSQEIRFEEVVKVDSTITKKDLFNTAKLWLNETFNSGKAVIQMEDPEIGIILGKASMKYTPSFFVSNVPAKGYIHYTIKLSFKNGKYKYELYDFVHQGSASPSAYINESQASIGLINDGDKYTGSHKALNKGYRNKVNKDCQKVINSQIPDIVLSIKKFLADNKNILGNDKSDW